MITLCLQGFTPTRKLGCRCSFVGNRIPKLSKTVAIIPAKFRFLQIFYQLLGTPYSYHEPSDVYDVSLGHFESPYNIIAEISKQIFNQNLSDMLEGFQMEDVQREEDKYVEQMAEMIDNQKENLPDPPAGAEDAYRDQLERHNRQVLSRL